MITSAQYSVIQIIQRLAARLDASGALRLLDHPPADAVLDGPAGVHELALREDLAAGGAADATEADHRRRADRLEDGVVDLCHGKSL